MVRTNIDLNDKMNLVLIQSSVFWWLQQRVRLHAEVRDEVIVFHQDKEWIFVIQWHFISSKLLLVYRKAKGIYQCL